MKPKVEMLDLPLTIVGFFLAGGRTFQGKKQQEPTSKETTILGWLKVGKVESLVNFFRPSSVNFTVGLLFIFGQISSRPHTSHSPQKVAVWFREMGPRLFQGNLAW